MPPPDVLDRVLRESSVVLVSAPAPARAVLVALALERGVPCVTALPIGLHDAAIRELEQCAQRTRAALVPWVSDVPLAQLARTASDRAVLAPALRERLTNGAPADALDPDPDWNVWSQRAHTADSRPAAFAALGLRTQPEPRWEQLTRVPQEMGLTLPPLETLAFERGLKPAVYLTLPRAEAERWATHFAGCAMASVDYDLHHDPVVDRRTRANRPDGHGTHRDLFIARDPAIVRQAKTIYEDPRGPSEHLATMGALLGYPSCCIAAFDALADRSNNTAIRHAAWRRTHALGFAFASVLNNLATHVLPWFPCTYACPQSTAHARAVLESLGESHPAEATTLTARIDRPVLYFDHARAIAFEHARRESAVAISYDRVTAVGGDSGAVTAAFCASTAALFDAARAFTFDTDAWTLERDGGAQIEIARERGAPGALYPFGV